MHEYKIIKTKVKSCMQEHIAASTYTIPSDLFISRNHNTTQNYELNYLLQNN